ncbi:MAG: hypothetical protein WCT28_03970 [Patescibacteria group bacterium]|jgi:hypothetical protein
MVPYSSPIPAKGKTVTAHQSKPLSPPRTEAEEAEYDAVFDSIATENLVANISAICKARLRILDQILEWIIRIRPESNMKDVTQTLFNIGILQAEALALCEMLNARSEEEKQIGVELILKQAFSLYEMNNPDLIMDYFDRPDWKEVVKEWRGSGTKKIRHVMERIARASIPRVTSGATPIEAPKIVVEKRQDPKAGVKKVLPGKLKGQAGNVQAALEILARSPTMSLTEAELSAAVERERHSCGASFPTHVVREVLPILERSGLIRSNGNGTYRHKPNAPNL